MGRFMSGLGMGMVAGACMGMAVVGMMSDADLRQMKRRAKKAVQAVEDAAAMLQVIAGHGKGGNAQQHVSDDGTDEKQARHVTADAPCQGRQKPGYRGRHARR